MRDPHEVFNQPPELSGINYFSDDLALREAVDREGGAWGGDFLSAYGALVDTQLINLGDSANSYIPIFQPFDRFGCRINSIKFHPAYHALMENAIAHEVHAFGWNHRHRRGGHVVRAALNFLHCQADAGTACPLTMTNAAVPVIEGHFGGESIWVSGAKSSRYDPRDVPASEKHGLTIGMGMTERQGGSDVRANTTRARNIGGGSYELDGHKWFFSAPMCDAFLVLAQATHGLSCFLMPRWRPDGTPNSFKLLRLKDKLGNRSNASSEVEFCGAWAQLVGDEGRGVPTIIQMVALTRLDCMMGSAALMRQALWQALHHCRHRVAFGKHLVDHPLMKKVLADLALESEAATALSMRVARAVDAAASDPSEAAFARIATAAGKYYLCKRAPTMIAEAAECLGGAGYIEESILPRLYREAPLNSIWEGCGNIQCLDVIRAMSKSDEAKDALFEELRPARKQNRLLDQAIVQIETAFVANDEIESHSRWLTELIAQVLQSTCLMRQMDQRVFESFCTSRLTERRSLCFGAFPNLPHEEVLLHRAFKP